VLLASVLVDHFAGLIPARATQAAGTVERLAMISCLLPAVILGGAGLIAMQYRLTRREVQSLQAEIAVVERPQIPA
jgi:Na+/melibiose symporter-like transporter